MAARDTLSKLTEALEKCQTQITGLSEKIDLTEKQNQSTATLEAKLLEAQTQLSTLQQELETAKAALSQKGDEGDQKGGSQEPPPSPPAPPTLREVEML